MRLIKYIDLVCEFSIDEEQARGLTYEGLTKRIVAEKGRRSRQKMLMAGNKGGKATAAAKEEEEAEEANEDKRLQKGIYAAFTEQSGVVSKLFALMSEILSQEPSLSQKINDYPNLESMLKKGMLLTENLLLR